jgi:hypothetical protein
MSVNLPDVAITDFASDVHAEFQSRGFKLRDAIRLRQNVVGQTVQFPVSAEGIAQQKAIQADVIPMNVDYDPITVNLEDWHASDYTDIFAQAEVNFDERMELVKTSAMAIGRRMDQMIIDALDNSGTANVIVNGGTNFTYDKLRQAIGDLHLNNAGFNGMYAITSAPGEEQLLDENQLTSSDFVNQRVIENGGLDGLKLAGVHWRVIGNMTEGGITTAANIAQCYLWDKMSVGMGIGIDFRTEINYVPEKLSWLVSSLFKANAVAIDPLGIVQVDIDETA